MTKAALNHDLFYESSVIMVRTKALSTNFFASHGTKCPLPPPNINRVNNLTTTQAIHTINIDKSNAFKRSTNLKNDLLKWKHKAYALAHCIEVPCSLFNFIFPVFP